MVVFILQYLGNLQSTTNWYLDEYSATTDIDATVLGLYKFYDIRIGKKLIQGNITSIATSNDICGSQDAITGNSNMLIPLQEHYPDIVPGLHLKMPAALNSTSDVGNVGNEVLPGYCSRFALEDACYRYAIERGR
ncbi:hypothetical protein M0R45_003726 [Rubus argutus]|uniref:Uncharacterized protein n=1 Tax=Rubus argutus TaxID=59490 RepID=A0AAW1YH81_RUBAR